MVAINKIIETHKRTWKGTLIGAVAGYYVAKKSIQTSNKWYIAAVVVGGAIAGSLVEDKMMTKTTKETEKKVAGVEK
jgi:outer membrane lipoprotein SlyB